MIHGIRRHKDADKATSIDSDKTEDEGKGQKRDKTKHRINKINQDNITTHSQDKTTGNNTT
jgi:hypothetical protein